MQGRHGCTAKVAAISEWRTAAATEAFYSAKSRQGLGLGGLGGLASRGGPDMRDAT